MVSSYMNVIIYSNGRDQSSDSTTKLLESKLVALFCNYSPKLKFLSGWTPIVAMCTRLSVQIKFTEIEGMLFSVADPRSG